MANPNDHKAVYRDGLVRVLGENGTVLAARTPLDTTGCEATVLNKTVDAMGFRANSGWQYLTSDTMYAFVTPLTETDTTVEGA